MKHKQVNKDPTRESAERRWSALHGHVVLELTQQVNSHRAAAEATKNIKKPILSKHARKNKTIEMKSVQKKATPTGSQSNMQ